MFVKIVFTIPEQGEVTLISKISALMSYPNGTKTLHFSTPIDFYGREGRERFLSIETYEDKMPVLVEENGEYPISYLSYEEEIPIPWQKKSLMRSPT